MAFADMPTFFFEVNDEAAPVKDGNSSGLSKADTGSSSSFREASPASTENDTLPGAPIGSKDEAIDHCTGPASKP
ncbi:MULTISPECIES: hypothetical protein [Bradyrhizobium]|uniref:hypothetical protein n=1 Tax=Bradyrhizobium TaxID=374 RepID=UPI000A19A8CB|nr:MULTISPECIES: hypothetical protein [Bradyrhizobium]OSI76525.1 hypothetical protein BSZ21_04090 [Bradyrhizobium canariense]WOH60197.1 hypothetical protein RX329_08835 [Bradyrhizobium sp. BWC-3-1]